MGWDAVCFKVKDNQQVLVFNDSHMLISSQVEGAWPPIDRIIPTSKKGSLETSGLSLSTAIKQLMPVLKSATHSMILLDTTPDGLHITASSEGQEFETTISAQVNGSLSFAMDAEIMLSGVNAAGSPLSIEWVDAKSPIVIKSVGRANNWLYVQMPMHRQ
jgi:DNA polymerase III sliding clamp (beta) subunit (PCNA family)